MIRLDESDEAQLCARCERLIRAEVRVGIGKARGAIVAFEEARQNCQLVPPLAGVEVTDDEAERFAPEAFALATKAEVSS